MKHDYLGAFNSIIIGSNNGGTIWKPSEIKNHIDVIAHALKLAHAVTGEPSKGQIESMKSIYVLAEVSKTGEDPAKVVRKHLIAKILEEIENEKTN